MLTSRDFKMQISDRISDLLNCYPDNFKSTAANVLRELANELETTMNPLERFEDILQKRADYFLTRTILTRTEISDACKRFAETVLIEPIDDDFDPRTP